MPKGKRKDKRCRREEESDDSASIASVTSEASNPAALEDGIDESSATELLEDKLKEVIDNLTEKSAGTRLDSLKSLEAAMKKSYMPEFYSDRKLTVVEALLRCLRRGGHLEQIWAAKCLALLPIQLGSNVDSEEMMKEARPVLETALGDQSVRADVRAECAAALGLTTFIAEEEAVNICAIMNLLQTQFSGSFLKGNATAPSIGSSAAALHAAALGAWSLAYTIAPSTYTSAALASTLPHLPGLLESRELELRCTAGETIALLYETARNIDQDFEGPDEDQLYASLKNLATDGAKSRAKRDRRQQRANFREILRSIEEGWSPRVQVKITHQGGAVEQLTLNSWRDKVRYDAICRALGTGMSRHLGENELLRDIFQMGPPPLRLSQHERQENKLSEKFENAANFKERTKARGKNRDKRFVTVHTE